ncbi:MAG: purine-nucleoside phosphorylase [Bacteroidetes bacterium]|nr:MAG: purine-nucleoside phosphorylase [Bacteroidota bacterium]
MRSSRVTDDLDDLEAAVAAVRRRVDARPEMALILGSGLGPLAEAAEDAVVIDTVAVPGYPRSTVQGHHGRLVFGHLEGRSVVFVQGRVHLYEGHDVRAVTFPVRLVHALGARRLLVTNAAGGIHPNLQPGTLMLITSHINLAFAHPPVDGPWVEGRGGRDGDPYDPAWLDQAERLALAAGLPVRRGVYLWTQGPSYETKAEIRAFARMGADAVGMSTVPEVLQAKALGMRVLGISTITNPAAGLGAEPLAHDDVLAVGRRTRSALERLVRDVVRTA